MRPGQPLHQYVLTRLLEFIDLSEGELKTRHQAYEELELLWLNYVSPDQVGADGQPKNPNKRAIVVPFTYAACQTLISHIYSAYTSRSVLLPLRATDPRNDRAAESLEAVLEQKHTRNVMSVRMYAWIQDALKYGQGRVSGQWRTEREQVVETLEAPLANILGMWPAFGRAERTTERVKADGPETRNIAPRDYLPDPRVPSWDPQAGEFICVRTVRGMQHLRQQQRAGIYFNVDRLRGGGAEGIDRGAQDRAQNMPSLADPGKWPSSDQPQTLHQVEVRLCPADWKTSDGKALGKSLAPEIWVFTVANKATIIQAEPMPNRHGQFRVAVTDGAVDVHALLGPSYPEIVRGVQDYADFAINSRIANVRMGLYMAFLYDPSMIEEEDIYSAQPGLRMRLKPDAARPASLAQAITQLDVRDVTAGLMRDLGLAGNMIQQTLGAVNILQGVAEQEKRTATEMGGAYQSARTRVGQVGALMWDQGVAPWGLMEISDAQQFLSQASYYRLGGAAARRSGEPRALIGPEDIQGEIEISPVDVTMPADRTAEGALWLKLATEVAGNERLNARLDFVEMFEEGARKLGAVNIDDFRRAQEQGPQAIQALLQALAQGAARNPMQATVMPDEAVMEQAHRGNLIPESAPEGGAGAALIREAMGTV
jgi:hypothetical protein